MTQALPSTGAITGVGEALAFFRNPDFARERFVQHGDIFETRLIGQRLIFIRGDFLPVKSWRTPLLIAISGLTGRMCIGT